MADDDPRDELARLGAAGRARRLAGESAERRRREREHQAERRHDDRVARLMTYTSWSSLTRWAAGPFYAALLLCFSWIFVLVREVAPFRDGELVRRAVDLRLGDLSLGLGLALPPLSVLGVWVMRRRDIAFRAGLPFATEGYPQVLASAVRSVRVEITFAAAPAPEATLRDLVSGAREPTRVDEVEGAIVRLEASVRHYSILDAHCRWMPRWYRALCRRILLPVHNVHPIVSVRLH